MVGIIQTKNIKCIYKCIILNSEVFFFWSTTFPALVNSPVNIADRLAEE
jgi:hypothetical protein